MSRTDKFEEAYAVVRADPPPEIPHDPSDHMYVKEIWWTLEEAEAEVERLNALAEENGTGSRYPWEYVRVRRRA